MLDVILEEVWWKRGSTTGGPVSLRIPRSSHTGLAGPSSGGKSSILGLIDGSVAVTRGRVLLGTRDVTSLRPAGRPVLHSAHTEVPRERWSVRRVLVAAARQRKGLDSADRLEEIGKAAKEWGVSALLERRVGELSSHEQLRVRLAQIILLRPAVLAAERLFASASPGEREELEDLFWRIQRAEGVTVIHEIARTEDIGWCDRIALIDDGSVLTEGLPQEVWSTVATPSMARSLGPGSAIPVRVAGSEVDSPIGSWSLPSGAAAFEGSGIAIIRPWALRIASEGEESDFIFGIDEARFLGSRWELSGLITGGTILKAWVDPRERVWKGRMVPMRIDPAAVELFAGGENAPGPRPDPSGTI
ncbi:MAG TPA: ATP-binding cassette domain-containing protein [Thermoanaerobaculia bacterium]|nr:ATP-binding cassette domain-containing protein [Thermoanaerobaculia bacterium]